MKTYHLSIDGKKYDVTVEGIEGGKASVSVNGTPYEVRLEEEKRLDPEMPSLDPVPTAGEVFSANKASASVTAPLPGVILEINVKEGQAVRSGEKVVVLEAMKMENEICADRSGTVTAVHVAKGDSVLEGAPLITIG